MYASFTSLNHDSEAFDSAAEKLLSYEELMEKYVQCEEELKTTSLKLEESEQEIEIQKKEAQENESDLRTELETLDVALYDSYFEYDELMDKHEECAEELKTTTLKLQESERENEKLKREAEARNISLDVIKGVWDESYAEISNLKATLNELQRSLTTEITKLHTDIKGHTENQTFLESLLKEMEDEEKFEKQEELINYDILMPDKYRYRVAIGKLKAALASSGTEIEEKPEEPNYLHSSKSRFECELGNAKNTAEELRDTIKELTKQAELQRNAISEVEKEKNEVIQRLCHCLYHYNVGRSQIMQFFLRAELD